MPQQLSFELPAKTALGRDDFFVSPSNASAVAMIDNWQSWPSRKLILIGPTGAGKTHLAHVWAALSGATIVEAKDLSQADIPALAKGHVAVENVTQAAGKAAAEQALFHLHNLTLAEGNSLLLSASQEAHLWGLTLPDLASRMQGTAAIALKEPDDQLLSVVLMKLFSDRQLNPTPDVLPYLTRHMDRSFEAARQTVQALDAAALAQGREINRKLARDILAQLSNPGLI